MASRSPNKSAFPSPQGAEPSVVTTPPPPGALEDILRRWRTPEGGDTREESKHMDAYSGHADYVSEGNEEDSMDDTEPARQPPKTAESPESAKRHRYLREADRHAILQRIDKGEKQAELAREFGVTRAAICHINKNRSQILARSTRPDVHEAARHPKRRMSASEVTQRHRRRQQHDQARASAVHEVLSPSLAIHLTTMRDRETDTSTFRAAADRACLVLVEEALAMVHAQPAAGAVDSDETNTTCAMVLDESGLPSMQAFRSIQPSSPIGFMTLECDEPYGGVVLRKMSTPLGLRDLDVLLLTATCATGDAPCVAIQSLLQFGARESSICLVTLAATEPAVAHIYDRHPGVRVVTAAVEPMTHMSLGLGNFVQRYFNTVVTPQGSIVGF